jgi:hypothetical protein
MRLPGFARQALRQVFRPRIDRDALVSQQVRRRNRADHGYQRAIGIDRIIREIRHAEWAIQIAAAKIKT